MVKRNVLMGMSVMVLTFGLAVAGCASSEKTDSGGEPVSLSGTTWKYQSGNGTMVFSFEDSTFTLNGTVGSTKMSTSGTYTVSGNKVAFKPSSGVPYKGTVSGDTLTTQGSKYTRQ